MEDKNIFSKFVNHYYPHHITNKLFMTKIKLTYAAVAVLIILSSCSNDDGEPRVDNGWNNRIAFRALLPEISSTKAQEVNINNFNNFQVTCFNPFDQTLINK